MLHRFYQSILIASLVFIPAIALAQEDRPRANRNGLVAKKHKVLGVPLLDRHQRQTVDYLVLGS